MKFLALLLLAPVVLPGQTAGGRAAAYVQSLQAAGFDPDSCFRVRDLAFQREDLKFHLADGHLIFSKPVEGKRHAALFTADVPGGDAEIILFPPHRSERLSLASFTKSPNLNEHFHAALFIFTDSTADELLAQIRETGRKPLPEIGTSLAAQHAGTLRNLMSSYEIRMAQDHFGAGIPDSGFFYAAMSGRTLGNFDVLYDPAYRDQILAGQIAYRDNRAYFDTWASFRARSFRQGRRTVAESPVRIGDIRIEATLQPPDLRIQAVTRLTMEARQNAGSAIAFDLSRRMKVTEARLNGEPVEVFARESMRTSLYRREENDTFLVLLPKPMDKGEKHTLEISHEGSVVTEAGNGVYFVGARTSWYPTRDASFARYELVFRHPKTLNLVATGELVAETEEDAWRVATHKTSSPIRFAGFNLGEYRTIGTTRAGVKVEVCANRKVEAALMQARMREAAPPRIAPFPNPRSRTRQPETLTLPIAPVPLNPAARLQELSEEIGSALEFLSSYLGPPPLKTLAVSPIPGVFGQGFPGLVYLSTLAYLNPADRPPGWRSEYQRTFFSELLHAHEVAHQWWGNLVTSAGYGDDWVMEGLANYSAMMILEKRKGRRALDSVLEEYRNNLLTKFDDKTVESAGPIIWGLRLNSSQTPASWRVITYEKGSWIMHMLRVRMGDERFRAMLGDLVKRKAFQPLTTDELRSIAAGHLPPNSADPKLEDFFEQWVYGTGLPSLKFSYTLQGKAPKVRLRGTVTQSDVDEEFSALAPVEIQLPGKRLITRWIRTSSDPVTFTVDLPQAPVKVTFDPANAVLSRK